MKKSKQKNVISRLFADMGNYKSRFWAVFAVIVIIKLCLASAPKVVSIITDTMQGFVTSGTSPSMLTPCSTLSYRLRCRRLYQPLTRFHFTESFTEFTQQSRA